MLEKFSIDVTGPFRNGEDEAYATICNAIVASANKIRRLTMEGPGNEVVVDLTILRALRLLENGIFRESSEGDIVGTLHGTRISVKLDSSRGAGSANVGRNGTMYIELEFRGLEKYPKLFE